MNIGAILQAPLAIQIHLATVLPAFAIGTWQILVSKKGARLHRGFGFVYLSLMTVTAVAAFFIRGPDGSMSLIHLFIPLTFFGVFAALWNVRRGDIAGHKRAMLGLYFGGILIAGTLAFMPGRIMHQLVFGSLR
jgi:uncharacterized membrane protein